MNASPLYNLLLWFGQFFLFVVGGALVLCAVFAWAGAWRGWARPDGGPETTTTGTTGRTRALPFTLGLLGVALCAWGLALDGVLRDLSGLAMSAAITGVVVAVLAGVSTRGWPAALTPRWHREQVRRGGERS